MDSILWFHLECPKDAAKFDDPIEFKRKWRNFFAATKATAEMLMVEDDEAKRQRKEFGHMQYPEDVKEHVSMRQFPDEFKHLSPAMHPEPADQFDEEEDSPYTEEIPIKKRDYGKKLPGYEFEGEDNEIYTQKFD